MQDQFRRTELSILIQNDETAAELISCLRNRFTGSAENQHLKIEGVTRISPKNATGGATNEVVTVLLSGVGGLALNIAASALYDVLKGKVMKLWVNRVETSLDANAIEVSLSTTVNSSDRSMPADDCSRPS